MEFQKAEDFYTEFTVIREATLQIVTIKTSNVH